MGDAKSGPVRLSFNPQLRVEFRGATVDCPPVEAAAHSPNLRGRKWLEVTIVPRMGR